MLPVRVLAIIVVFVVLVGGWGAAFVMWRAAEIGEIVGPVEARDFETLTVVNVGTGGVYENPERLGPSTAIGLGDAIVLVDAGRGLAPALRRARIPMTQPTVVLLTHLLPDNLLRELERVAKQVIEDEAARDASFAKILESQRKFRADYSHWKSRAYLPRDF